MLGVASGHPESDIIPELLAEEKAQGGFGLIQSDTGVQVAEIMGTPHGETKFPLLDVSVGLCPGDSGKQDESQQKNCDTIHDVHF